MSIASTVPDSIGGSAIAPYAEAVKLVTTNWQYAIGVVVIIVLGYIIGRIAPKLRGTSISPDSLASTLEGIDTFIDILGPQIPLIFNILTSFGGKWKDKKLPDVKINSAFNVIRQVIVIAKAFMSKMFSRGR